MDCFDISKQNVGYFEVIVAKFGLFGCFARFLFLMVLG